MKEKNNKIHIFHFSRNNVNYISIAKFENNNLNYIYAATRRKFSLGRKISS